ncbi:MAG: DEAD/DEAH box helicase [Proteobacteria bacterium]|nr:DEAD/DEAH box helicase [Pseudomonadota bacterium]
MTTFENLNLNPKILTALESKGYKVPTPIQLQAIPPLLEGRDILGVAQTGTGKTAAFSLPIIHNLFASNNPVKGGSVRALILTPTRELASQIAENIELYGKDLNLSHTVIFGGVSERPQIAKMQRGVDILIATPGRLLDLATQGYIRFMNLEIFVLDEADRMLDMGFFNDIKKIIAKIPERRQTLFFSATMPEAIADLANSILKNPIKIEITPQATTVERIEQKINFVEKGNKLSLLKRILKEDDAKSVLVFSKTKHGANRIEEFLEKNSISVAAIHGNKSQGAREKALASFREGKVQVLIATDIAARGIDVPAISHVINFDIPMDPESYVHRIGRTARAGRQGIAISFCDPSEKRLLQAVEKTIRFKIPVDETHAYHGVAAAPASHTSEERSSRPKTSRSHPSRPSNRDERPASSARSNDRRSAAKPSHSRDDRKFSNTKTSDRRPRRSEEAQPDGTKSSLLSFIGFGRKRSNDRQQARSETRDTPFRVKEEEKGGGFGLSWLKGKKSDSRGSRSEQPTFVGRDGLPPARNGRNFNNDRRSDSFGNSERPASRSNSDRRSSSFGGGFDRDRRSSSSSSDRRSGSSFGSDRSSSFRSDDSRNNRSGDRRSSSAERSGSGFKDRREGSFLERRPSSNNRDRKPFGDRRPASPRNSW